jgi:hypothetical protein
VNFVKNGIMHPAIYYDDMGFLNASFRSGSKHIYSIFSFGTQQILLGKNTIVFAKEDENELIVWRVGLGLELPIGPFFIDFDVTAGSILDLGGKVWKNYESAVSNVVQARLSLGLEIFKHFGFFAGISYTHINLESNTSPNPDSYIISDPVFEWGDGKYVDKIGLFAGIQF